MRVFIKKFNQIGRAKWAGRLLIFICVVSLLAPVMFNDRPIVAQYDGRLYFPIFSYYAETEFGGDFDTEPDYKDVYFAQLLRDGDGWALWPLVRYNYGTINYDTPTPAPSPPTWENLLGTDDQGRDVLARTVYGVRISLAFAAILTIVSSVIGIAAGLVQGYFGGAVDLVGQRFMEIWGSMPRLFVLLILASMLAPGFWILLGVLLLFSWMELVQVVRTEALRTRQMTYVRAARALGVGTPRIMLRHILPGSIVAATSFLPFILAGGVTTLTSLDFLGFGLPPGSASLGELLSQAKANLHAYWIGVTGFMSVAILLSLLVFIGEGVRHALDPQSTE